MCILTVSLIERAQIHNSDGAQVHFKFKNVRSCKPVDKPGENENHEFLTFEWE